MQRVVEPEIIDQLPPDHPDVVRSRIDLKVINFLMGNERWIARQIREFPEARAKGVLEIGAGEGTLLEKLAKHHPGIPLKACDLAPRPPWLEDGIVWDQRDVFECLAEESGGILAANLFLHHFEEPELRRFAPLMRNFELICINEPFRTAQTIMDARFMLPFVGRATKHDMVVSIKAGFVPGELPELLGLAGPDWQVREETCWRGGLRVLASRV
jgi:2-polyprenyl-3-methyl-5-hydroxy-6-metoxy-1,4-benzoquinol methylase